MLVLSIRPIVIALFATTLVTSASFAQTQQSQKARCDQLMKYFDYYGQSRGEGVSDGARNMNRIGAGVDCSRGNYQQGIAMIETLLRNKKMGVPAPQPG